MIKIKRAYQPPEEEDGFRILVDRLWPRGVSKDKVKLDLWLKEVAPSNELRKWFGHDPEKWSEFQKRYSAELKDKRIFLSKIKDLEKEKGTVTLIYSAKDEEHNDAVVLRDKLQIEEGKNGSG
ncbi:MAG: DUF488 domain-containing protein [Methanobacteriaceae archaeon]|nr:DUF488 domain-containing protein [Methanobacteriaceae archaeon]OPY24298.1 MAG: hypothetical protein A4E26_00378 [Methanobacterium sp. PtaU1.Bin097]